MHRWLLATVFLLAGCPYLAERASCSDACEQLFSEEGCDIPTDDAGVGEGTATFACTQSCADRDAPTRQAFLDCVNTSTCEQIDDGACDFEELTGRTAP